MAQTEFERGYIAGATAMKERNLKAILDTYVIVPKQEKEAQ